jgi:hypothetical protein
MGNETGHSYTCAPYVSEVPIHIDRQMDDRMRCKEGNMNYELEFVVLVYFKALFQPSRTEIRFMAGTHLRHRIQTGSSKSSSLPRTNLA